MITRHITPNMTSSMIKEIIATGYYHMVKERLEEGWQGYLITFMFKGIRGARQGVIRQMQREVERVYATVLTRVLRPSPNKSIAAYPLWIVCPDFPVPKHAKMDLKEVTVNDGLHYRGLPSCRLGTG